MEWGRTHAGDVDFKTARTKILHLVARTANLVI